MTMDYDAYKTANQEVEADSNTNAGHEQRAMPGMLHQKLAELGPRNTLVPEVESLMRQYPQQTSLILDDVRAKFGNGVVQKVIALHQSHLKNQFVRDEILNDDLDGGSASSASASSVAPQTATPTPAPIPEPAKSSPEVEAATHYNRAHLHIVDEFNALTAGVCVGADGRVDASLVMQWQAEHGLQADGKVGPHTLAAAKKLATSNKPEADATPVTSDDQNPEEDQQWSDSAKNPELYE